MLTCVACCCKFPSRLDFGATPRDEIHLLCLLRKDKPIKSTSGYYFTCDVEWVFFFLGPVNNETLHHMETSTIKDFTLSTAPVYLFYFIIFQIGIPSQYILSISAKVKFKINSTNS